MSPRTHGSFLDYGQAYRKAADYCAIQDRCKSEMLTRLKAWQIDRSFFSKIMNQLLAEGFINEKRFALNYAGGKFRINGWGKIKIAAGLRSRSIPNDLIQNALATIDNGEYKLCLEKLLQKKLKQIGGDTLPNRQKAFFFAASRGFEQGLIASTLSDIEPLD